jgi:hypothetical protein
MYQMPCPYCDLRDLQRQAWCEGLEVMVHKLPFGFKVSVDMTRSSYVTGKMPEKCTCKQHKGYVHSLQEAARMLDIQPMEEGT